MALYVSGHYPSMGAVDIPRNPVIQVYFNSELNTSSIDYKVLTVHDNLYSTVPGTVSYTHTYKYTPSGIANILTFTPSILLDASKEYAVYVHNDPDSVEDINGNTLADTIKFKFTTGITTIENNNPTTLDQLYLDLQVAVDNSNWTEAAKIQALIDNGGLPLDLGSAEESVSAGIYDIRLSSTYPTDAQSNIDINALPFIRMNFSDAVYASGIDMSDYIELTYKNVLE